jgi:hypothetical protein
VAGEGGDEVLHLEEETREVRRDPKGVNGGGTVELTEGGEEAVAATQNTARVGGGSDTGADERSRKWEERLWCASKGEWGRERKGVRRWRAVPFKRCGGRQGKERGSGSVPTWRREKDGGGGGG